jgi:hypothetical protein
LSKNAEEKNDEKFGDLLNDVKEKKEKSKSKDKEAKKDDVNGDGNVNGTIDSNIDGDVNGNGDSNNDGNNTSNVTDIDKSKGADASNSSSDSGDDESKLKPEADIIAEKNPSISISIDKSEPKKIKRTYYIYEDQDKKLNEMARKSDRDKSNLIRLAIDFLYNNAEIN